MADVTETVMVPVTVRVTVTRTVEVTVPVEQTGPIDPSSHDWPDVADLYDQARQLVHEDEGLLIAQAIECDGWRVEPSKEGEPWRPVLFGGRM